MKLIIRFLVLLIPMMGSGSEISFSVGLYKNDLSVESFGISKKRKETQVNLEKPASGKNVRLEKGILTAVILNGLVAEKIRLLFELKPKQSGSHFVLTRKKGKNGHYQLLLKNGLRIEFSVEKSNDRIGDHIRMIYNPEDPARLEVLKEYENHYILRIYSAPDTNRNGLLDIQDAMSCATLLGDNFQPLIGIHNGNGLLSQLF